MNDFNKKNLRRKENFWKLHFLQLIIIIIPNLFQFINYS